jgi:alpha-D-xyloside xylohydrolase
VSGPRWVSETHGFESVPLLVRPNTVVPLGARDDVPDYAHADGVTLALFQVADGASIETSVPSPSGDVAAAFRTVRSGDTVEVQRTSGDAAWNVLVVGAPDVEVVSGQPREPDALGARVRLSAGDATCRVRLP